MMERKTEEKFSEFLSEDVEIILNNQMHYTGRVISIGTTFLKLNSTRGEDVFIILEAISSVVKR